MQSRLSKQIVQILILLGILFAVHTINVAMKMSLTQYGVIPRSLVGLRGVIFSPLLHGDWQHLAANTVPLGVMLTLMAINQKEKLWTMTAVLWVGAGLGIWIIGRSGYQIGASALIYALASYFIVTAWRTRKIAAVLTAVAVSFLYGGIVWGLLPGKPGVSWEGHLAGAVAGVLVALTIHPKYGVAPTPPANPPANPPVQW